MLHGSFLYLLSLIFTVNATCVKKDRATVSTFGAHYNVYGLCIMPILHVNLYVPFLITMLNRTFALFCFIKTLNNIYCMGHFHIYLVQCWLFMQRALCRTRRPCAFVMHTSMYCVLVKLKRTFPMLVLS